VWPDGDVNGALRFRGTGIAVGIPASFDDHVGTDITVEAWLYWEGSTVSPMDYIIMDARDYESGDGNGGFALFLDTDGKLTFETLYGYTSNPWPYQIVRSGSPIPVNIWTHVAGVLDYTNGELRVYINGMEDWKATAAEPYWKMGAGGAAIGNNRYAPGDGRWRTFNGRIDEVRVSDVASQFGGAFREPLYLEPLPPSGTGAELAQVLVNNVNWGIASGKGYLLDEKKRDELAKKVGEVRKALGSPDQWVMSSHAVREALQKMDHASRLLTKVSNPNCYLTENRYNFLGLASKLLEYPDVNFTVTVTPPADPADPGRIAFDGMCSTGEPLHLDYYPWWCGVIMGGCLF
jgi:hypothetical protein